MRAVVIEGEPNASAKASRYRPLASSAAETAGRRVKSTERATNSMPGSGVVPKASSAKRSTDAEEAGRSIPPPAAAFATGSPPAAPAAAGVGATALGGGTVGGGELSPAGACGDREDSPFEAGAE